MPEQNSLHVAVFGMGYVGCVSAACLASMGHRVTGIDCDETKLSAVRRGAAPFFEPGLQELIEQAVSASCLAASSDARAMCDADIALICVGTPSERNGNLGLRQLERVISEIAETIPQRSKPLVIAVRSTVFPGTCQQIVMPAFRSYPSVSVVSNPEFLREGTAVNDFMRPSLLVVGGEDPSAVDRVCSLYSGLPVTACRVSLRTAEMIKYACNAFHAIKIAFANEIGAISAQLAIDPGEVMQTLCQDHQLNVSSAYLKPGFAFGGSCLPKDLRALTYRANRLDLDLPLLDATLSSNRAHLQRAIDAVLELPGRLGVVGLAFKENTDDLRESPVVAMLEYLIGKGREVRVFDPHIQLSAIYGSNRDFLLRQIPHIGKLLASSIEEVAMWADHLVVAQKPTAEVQARLTALNRPVVDLVSSSLAYSNPAHSIPAPAAASHPFVSPAVAPAALSASGF